MAATPPVPAVLLINTTILLLLLFRNVSGVGINYGTLGNNLPHPKQVAQMLQSTLIDKVKIYDTNPEILDAFSNSGVDVIVAVENDLVANISQDVSAADRWFTSRISPFLPATSVVTVVVGNEYLTGSGSDTDSDPVALVRAMKNVHAVLVTRGLDRKIKVSTPHSMAVLASSFPPSSATFVAGIEPAIRELVEFLSETGGDFMVNAYPYFAYRDNPSRIDLEYALLGNATGVRDSGHVYTNMLDAQIDAVRSAINALGFGNRTVEITISESGWPSKGDPGDTAATPENARIYNTRLIGRADGTVRTPKGEKADIFLFALFNENLKKGGASERNFGIFNGDGSKVYEVDLKCSFCSEEKMGEKGGGGGPRGASVWCVAKPHAEEKVVQAVLDFCCGAGGVDCRELEEEKGGCSVPKRVHAHASYAMNGYYQMHGRNYWNCDFKGTGLVTFSDPSYGSCRYPQQ